MIHRVSTILPVYLCRTRIGLGQSIVADSPSGRNRPCLYADQRTTPSAPKNRNALVAKPSSLPIRMKRTRFCQKQRRLVYHLERGESGGVFTFWSLLLRKYTCSCMSIRLVYSLCTLTPSFTVKTRTCLTHAIENDKPATRMFCTSQCDWSSFSMLKSTITPAVIKGQKAYHEKLAKSIRGWIESHPDDFALAGNVGDNSTGGGSVKENAGEPSSDTAQTRSKSETAGGDTKTLPEIDEIKSRPLASTKSTLDHILEIPGNPVMLGITLLCALLLFTEIYRLMGGSGGGGVGSGVTGVPAKVVVVKGRGAGR